MQIGSEFADAQGRSVVIAFDTGQPEPSPDACPPPHGGGTTTTKPDHPTTTKPDHGTTTTKPDHGTTTVKETTTTAKATTTTQPNQTTTTGSTWWSHHDDLPDAEPVRRSTSFRLSARRARLPPGISITFGNRPDLDGQTGMLDFSDGTSYGPLVFQSNTTVTIPWPGQQATSPLTLTYTVVR